MMDKVSKIIVGFVFFVSITLPFVFSDFGGGDVSFFENRRLAVFPKLLNSDGKFDFNRDSLELWLNDNIGFRKKSYDFKHFVDLNLFNLTYANEVIGKDNWLFLLTPDNIKRAQNNDLLSIEQIDEYKKRLANVSAFFNSKGIEFCLMAFPHKIDLYPEYLPDTIIKVNNQSRIEQVKDNFENNPFFDFEVPLPALLEAKNNMIICSQSADSAHWNNNGAFIGYLQLIKQIKDHINEINILSYDDFDIIPFTRETFRVSGGGAEIDHHFNLKQAPSAMQNRQYLIDIGFNPQTGALDYDYYQNTDISLPKAIIAGDSYIYMFMLPWLAESFSELVFIHAKYLAQLPLLCEVINPDIVIGSGLDGYVLSIAFMDITENAGNKTKNIDISNYNIKQGLTIKPDGSYTTEGNDSYIYFELNEYIIPNYCVIEFEELPENATYAELLYTHSDDYFSNYGVIRFELIDQKNTYRLDFDDDTSSINRIRLGFRNIPGKEFKIKNIYVVSK